MSILKVPIQINGGNAVPNDLLDRELFINSDGYLYYGKLQNGIFSQHIVNANICKKLVTPDATVWVSGDKNSDQYGASFGNIKIDCHRTESGSVTHWSITGNKKTTIVNGVATETVVDQMQSINVDDCAITDLNKLQLTSDVYGNTPPSTAIDGQVFFKIVEN